MTNVYETRREAEEFIQRQRAPEQHEIMIWTNKEKQKRYSVIRKKSAARDACNQR